MAKGGFVRDELGRFARTAGKRLKKAARSELDRAAAKAEEKISESINRQKQIRQQAAVDKAEKNLAKWVRENESDMKAAGPQGSYDEEYSFQQREKAKLAVLRAKEKLKQLQQGD